MADDQLELFTGGPNVTLFIRLIPGKTTMASVENNLGDLDNVQIVLESLHGLP